MPENEPKTRVIYVGEGLDRTAIEVDTALLDKLLQQTSSSNPVKKSDVRLKREIDTFHAALANGGDMQKAMLTAGYPKSMVKPSSAHNLSKSPTFKKMLEYYFPPDVLMEHEASLLNSENPKVKDRSLDRIHKLLGNFQIKVEVSAKSDEMKKHTDEELYAIAHDTADIVEGEFEDVSNKSNDDEPSTTS